MPEVWKFPPVAIAAYENSFDDPMSISRGAGGAFRGSQVRANRAVYNISVSGIGKDRQATGQLEFLKRQMAGKLPLVSVDTLPAIWWKNHAGRGALNEVINWTVPDEGVSWLAGGSTVTWRKFDKLTYTAGTAGDWDYIDIDNLEPGLEIHVNETIFVDGAFVGWTATHAKSDGGTIRILTTDPVPIGDIEIGKAITRNFLLVSRPSITQQVGAFSYDAQMIEVFQSDYVEPFTVGKVPWT